MPDLIGLVSYATFFLVFAAVFAVIVLGLNLQWGFTGLFNVGVAGFVAVGAYASALLTGPDYPGQIGGLGLPVAIGWLGAMAASGVVALVVGVAALRLRHDYLAITTFGIAVTLQLVALNAQSLTGGPFGLQFVPKPLADAIPDNLAWNAAYLAIAAIILGAAYAALERLVRSPWGRVLRAIREDEVAAESLGKRAFRFRLQAFVIGCMLMGLGGALYAHFVGYIAPEDFLPILTFQLWTMLIVGGSGNNRGAILGALVVWALWTLSGGLLREIVPPEHLARAATLQVVLIGLALMAILLLRPRGILGEEAVVSRHTQVPSRSSHAPDEHPEPADLPRSP
jgi:branched-chain amino acid transport system permease protein